MQDSQRSISVSADVQCYNIINIVLECNPEDSDHPNPTTMNVQIFSSESKIGEALIMNKVSQLVWKHPGIVKLTGDTAFRATWDDTGNVGVVNLTKAELKECTGSDKGFRREMLMKTDDVVFKLRLRFDICCVTPEERRVPQIEEDPRMANAEGPEEILRIALELSDNTPDKADLLYKCGSGFARSFLGNTTGKEDINNCILAYETAVHLTPQGHSEMSGRLNELGVSLYHRFHLTGDLDDISKAVSIQQKAIHLTPEGHPNMPRFLSNLGNSVNTRFQCMGGDLADISYAISYAQKAVHLTPEGNANMPMLLSNLGNCLQSRFEHRGDSADIFDSISYKQRAIHLTPEGHANMPILLSSLGNSFLRCFKCTGDHADVSKAISYQQKGVYLAPEGHESMHKWLNNLGVSFETRFKHTGDLADISNAISYQQKAIQLTPEGHESMPKWLYNLGISFETCFKHTGDLADISNAISYQQKAIHLTPEGHADMTKFLNSLKRLFQNRFEHTGDLADISDAISYQQKAIHLTPEGHADMTMFLNSLGSLFQNRFEHTGDLADISDAISYQQKAIHLTPEGHADMTFFLNNLACSLRRRFECMGDLADISDSISYLQKVVYLTPEGHKDMPRRLNNLGNSFGTQFDYKLKGDPANISDSISYIQKAVHLTSEDHVDMPVLLNNLGLSFETRCKHTGDLADISDAIKYHQKAVHLTPEGHPNLPRILHNVGNSFRSRFELGGDPADISNSISYHLKAVHLTPDGHADVPENLINLGSSFESRFKLTGDLADIHKLLSIDCQCATYFSGLPSTRLWAAFRWAKYCSFDPSQSLEAYNTAIQLVSQMAGLEQTIQKRHTNLLKMSDIVTTAAAQAFNFRRPELALEWLEQGRCLIWSQINNLRSPLDSLFACDPEIAQEMLRVSKALENAGSQGNLVAQFQGEATMEHKMSIQDEANNHVKLAQKWNELVTKIRTIPNFEDFLQPPSCSNLLKNLPDSGPVVVINVHRDSCDALALISGLDEPLHIPLHKFSFVKATDLHNNLKTHLRAINVHRYKCEPDTIRATRPVGDNDSDSVIKHILHQLWILVVKPILDGLGFSEPPSKLPRIWWCATGPLAFLPIHAAGIYATSITKAGPSLPDFAISSYIPNVKALTERVLNSHQVLHKRGKKKTAFFMISQPETPNLPRIPGTTKEVLAIMQLFKNHNIQFLSLEGEAATADQGITYMETHSCVHFACHAHQNTQEPLKSGFMLHDGGLDLSEIIKRKLEEADLAYLSACQTSTGDERLSEEAVHLAGGMLAAGYRGVVATMWSISDQHGAQVAKDFYARLISQNLDPEGLTTDNAASALHYSTQKLRKQLNDSVVDWIPYVHFGL